MLGAAYAWDAPSVRVLGCPELSGERIAEHLVVEHPEFREAPGPRVELICNQRSIVIVVENPVTQERVERTVDAPRDGDPGRDRTVALATSSLIVASSKERTGTSGEPYPPSSSLRGNPTAREVADPVGSVQGMAGIRFRDLGEGLLVSQAGLRAGWFVRRHLEIFGQANVEYGVARRDRGQVDVVATALGPGIAWTLRPGERVGFETWAAIMAGYARIAGRTTVPEVESDALHGATGEVDLGLGPKLRAGSFTMVLDLRVGYTLPTLRGGVTGETNVRHGGFWTGVGLRAGAVIGRARRRARPPASDRRSR